MGGEGGVLALLQIMLIILKVHDSVCDTITYLLIMKSLEYG